MIRAISHALPVTSNTTRSSEPRLAANSSSTSGRVAIRPAEQPCLSSAIATSQKSRCTSSPIALTRGDSPGRANVMAAATRENLERLGRLLADGTLRVPVQATYELSQAPEALGALATTHKQGKLAIRIT
jgi:NADPH:quinone reductase-like Zn-dependent oxidoreductase